MDYAEVCVNSPAARRQTFSYSIPSHLKVTEGEAVLVPFGAQILQGIVLQLTAQPAVEQTRDIAGIVDSRPLLSPERIELARWISDYYLAPIFDAVALLLPPGFERKVLTFVSAAVPEDFDSSLTPDQQQVLDTIAKQTTAIGTAALGRLFGKKKAQQVIAQLVKKHLLIRTYDLEPIKVRAKTESHYALKLSPLQARQEAQKLRSKAKRQAEFLEFLADMPAPASVETIRQRIGFRKSVADALIKKGFINGTVANVRRDPLAHLKTNLSWPLPLTANQSSALSKITSSLGKIAAGTGSGDVFLLHGVTGSGKTEVYLQALAEAVKLGKKGIVLVPEIALTPQTLERFTARFPGRVAILHSQLTLGEQFDEWSRIRNGEVDVVVGPRSALFAPQPDLGLIVIDEEHEWNYKQTDRAPTYHARAVALRLAGLTGASVILGSATPDVETYYHARKGDYRLLDLPERLISAEVPDDSQVSPALPRAIDASLPGVDVVDMREELKAGNRSLFSRALHQAVAGALSVGGQVILFLNRRGASTFVQCRRCGFSFRCRRCDVPMTYHAVEEAVICHQCNYRTPRPEFCPRCRSPQIKFLGLGTEKLEQETAEAFPRSRLLRWDGDTTRGWHSHQEILDKFRRHEAEILIGTQMVSKGLDMPRVTLVGVINADTGLNLPDFRAGERTFQLLSQVAGRAGRGPMGGRVVIQTYSPEHYTIQAAAKHDYAFFYGREIEYRRELHQPPFAGLASMTYSLANDVLCRKEAERMKRELNEEKEANGLRDFNILGPAPAFIRRRRGHFRWQLVVRGSNPSAFLREIDVPQGWKIDIDPIGLG